MNQWVPHQVKTNLFCERRHLLNDAAEKIQIDQFFRTNDLRAETALQVTYVTDFDVHLGETLGRHDSLRPWGLV
ncbi:hypothetical protein D3C87_1491580 [compost metagenome]